MTLPGIGPKTASWIVRNWMNSDAVAILDIHIVRAGMLMNLYCQGGRVERHYLEIEAKIRRAGDRVNRPDFRSKRVGLVDDANYTASSRTAVGRSSIEDSKCPACPRRASPDASDLNGRLGIRAFAASTPFRPKIRNARLCAAATSDA